MKDGKTAKILSVITVGVIIFAGALLLALVLILYLPPWIAIGISVFCALMLGVLIYVMIERIKEIRSGEEDDLSKY